MVEAMACGTPVVATNCGSVPEIIEDGVSGYICRSLRELIDSVAAARRLDRAGCRAYAEARFSSKAMTDGYERIYRQTFLSNDPDQAAMESARSPGRFSGRQGPRTASGAYAHSAGGFGP
jgi:Glycosyl transferases group 1